MSSDSRDGMSSHPLLSSLSSSSAEASSSSSSSSSSYYVETILEYHNHHQQEKVTNQSCKWWFALISHMHILSKQVRFQGLTGPVEFNAETRDRVTKLIDIVNIQTRFGFPPSFMYPVSLFPEFPYAWSSWLGPRNLSIMGIE